MKLKLSDEQISLLVSNETERLHKRFNVNKQKLDKKYEAEVNELKNRLEADIAKLTNKFKYIEVAEPTPLKVRIKIDGEVIKQMVAEKKTVREMAARFKTSESSIRSKLFTMNIKLLDKNK